MKKILYIIYVLLLIIVFDCIGFYVCLNIFNKELKSIGLPAENHKYRIIDNEYQDNSVSQFFKKKKYQIFRTNAENKNSILLFGCSYAFGVWLPYEQRFSRYLSDLLESDVLSFAYGGWGAHHMLWLSEREETYNIINSSLESVPSSIIYVYMQDHVHRQTSVRDNFYEINPYTSYYEKNGVLKERKYNFLLKCLYRLFMVRTVIKEYELRSGEQNFQLLEKVILKAKRNLEEHFPNTPFYMFAYIQWEVSEEEQLMFDNLKKNGVILVKTTDLSTQDLFIDEYLLADKYHPNAKAWKLISPLFVDYMKSHN